MFKQYSAFRCMGRSYQLPRGTTTAVATSKSSGKTDHSKTTSHKSQIASHVPNFHNQRIFLSSGALDWGGPGGVANWTVSFQKRGTLRYATFLQLSLRYSEWISVTTFLASWSHPTTRLVPRDLRFDIQLLQSVKPHSHCADVATVHPDAGQPVYRDAPGHIS